ncbi:hypothetical protein [Nitrospirillum iridis]|uniref:Uncharacterized protein n=1 Tax=Nitrospirillum iridis TaxID=765888 RepID=A0A7X0EAM7_9PROT|nr:hypothetical protein [Nitrospirillum iridis]MBB6249643.1 hypothetical protein [Nitrospirillum iridis]
MEAVDRTAIQRGIVIDEKSGCWDSHIKWRHIPRGIAIFVTACLLMAGFPAVFGDNLFSAILMVVIPVPLVFMAARTIMKAFLKY